MKQILCCVSAGAHSRPAVKFAVELASAFDAQINFLVVNETKAASGSPPIKAYSDAQVQEILDVALRYAASHGAKRLRRIVSEGPDAADAIIECAKEVGADHIVVGTGNPSALGRLLLGSVSQAVLTRVTCSVTVAR